MESSSLQRLLALNKSKDSFLENLAEGGRILQLPDGWSTYNPTSAKRLGKSYATQKRAEWLLKWLLERLSATAVHESVNPRLQISAWTLLTWITTICPVSTTGKHLTGIKFLDIVRRTLGEINTPNATSSSLTSPEPQKPGTTSSKKRKRNSQHPDLNGNANYSNIGKLLKAVQVTLETLIDLTDTPVESSGIGTANEQLEAALKISVEDAAGLLHLWQTHLLQNNDFLEGDLSAVLRIWHWSTLRGTTDSHELASLFSRTCLVPTLKLLVLAESHAEANGVLRQQLEQLLSRHIPSPIRSFSLKAFTKSRRKKDGFDEDQVRANDLLAPLHDEVLALVAKYGPSSVEALRFLQSFHIIFGIALRVYQRSTPKHRSREEHWLRGLFRALSASAGSPVDGDETSALQSQSKLVLDQLLDMCLRFNFSPGADILESIMQRYSGMYSPGEESIAWTLIAKALRIDATIFLPQGSHHQTAEGPLGDQDLHSLLVRHLSSVPWTDQHDHISTSHGVALPTETVEDQSTVAFREQSGVEPDEFMTLLPIALMNAYANARNLGGFLDVWRTELIRSTRHIVIGSGHSSVWESQQLAAALRQTLETSLTERQVLEILIRFSAPFAQLEEAQNIMYVFTELRQNAQGTGAAANLVVLDALVAAIWSDDVIALGLGQLSALYESLLAVGSKPAINKLPLVHRIWRFLANIKQLILPTLPEDSQEDFIHTAVASPCTQAAVEAVREACVAGVTSASYTRATYAFNFLVSLHSSEKVIDLDSATLEHCIDWTLVRDSMPRFQTAQNLLRYPHVFEKISPEKRQALFQEFVTQYSEEMERLENANLQTIGQSSRKEALDAILELCKTSFSANVRLSLLQSFSHELDHLNPTSGPLSQGNLSESMLMQLPVNMLPRTMRQQWLDQIYQFLSSYISSNPEAYSDADYRASEGHLAFMVRLMEAPNTGAEICKSPDSLLRLCSNTSLINADCGRVYEELVRRVLSHAPSQNNFAMSLAETIIEKFKSKSPTPHYASWYAMRPLLAIVDPASQKKLLLHEVRAFDSINRYISSRTASLTSTPETVDYEFAILVDSIRSHWNLVEATDEGVRYIQQWRQSRAKADRVDRTPGSKTKLDRYLLMEINSSAYDQFRTVLKTLEDERTLLEQTQLLADLKNALTKCSADQRLNIIDRFDELSAEVTLTDSSLRVLQVLLGTLSRSVKSPDESSLNVDVLARLAIELGTCSDVRIFSSICNCIKTLISERTWLVSQYGIDTLIGNLTLVTSASATSLPNEATGGIYSWICAMTTTAIALHRIKLQGRFHSLMPLLINLLNCLFIPHSGGSKSNLLRLPSYVSAGPAGLSAKHAAAFARLLSTLSSPTISSVSSYKRRRTENGSSAPLKDETKVARSYIGEYVPVLLSAYCSAQLNGKMDSDVKAALMPGLWSCMETVEMDAWRAMSERMKENERAIWQSVWAEWRRIGGGRHDRSNA